MTEKEKKKLARIALAALLLGAAVLLEEKIYALSLLLFACAYLSVGFDVLRRAAKGIRRGQAFDENFLMAVATIGAIALGEYAEAAEVMIFYQVGELFESLAVGRSRKSISALMDIRPDYANVRREDGSLDKTDPDEIETGTEIVILPGERIPIDGRISSGSSFLDTAALTGESRQKRVAEGDEVLSGCINLTGALTVITTKEFGESTASKILELVENASSSKSRSENFIARFARIYTPVVCLLALALALLPPLFCLALGRAALWGSWLYRALTFLVISCPCALVISIPLAFFGGLGGAGNAGILIKGSNYMEPLSRASAVVFDKTGTLTKGVFEVAEVFSSTVPEKELIEAAAYAEYYSNHPISFSLKTAYGRELQAGRTTDAQEFTGEGVSAQVGGQRVVCGNEKIMARFGADVPSGIPAGTAVHVMIDGTYSGCIVIRDALKPGAKEALEALHSAGVKQTAILTGDNAASAAAIAELSGADRFYSDLLPADKVRIVEEMLARHGRGESLLFVGDGINDAPVLARADVGIAMGGIGSDAAVEAADVVLMDDDLRKIPKAIRIAKKCIRIVYENIFAAIGVKLICLALSAFGVTGMGAAIFADVGVMVLAVLNSIRALRVKNI